MKKTPRTFLPSDLSIHTWEDIAPYFDALEQRSLATKADIETWLAQRSELFSAYDEELAWRYIRMNCNTNNEELFHGFNQFIANTQAKVETYSNRLDKKLHDSPAYELFPEEKYQLMFRSIRTGIELFREENVEIKADLQQQINEYGLISSNMSVEHDGETYTMQAAGNFLQNTDRSLRQVIFEKMGKRRLEDKERLDVLLDDLLAKRHRLALNAGFDNYRDFKYVEMERFDYGVDDVHRFHEAIEQEVKPLVEEIHRKRLAQLEYDRLRPYDLKVDPSMLPPLQPFITGSELLEKSIRVFHRIKPEFGEFLDTMRRMEYLDLESRLGKAPGGFNYPLYESNVPFIYMNATGNLRDLETLMHEGGHAIHSFLSAPLDLVDFKQTPTEVAELASMSMELMSMDYWDEFFNPSDWIRAKRSQLEGVLDVLPWVATIDAFQDWLYTHPGHSHNERKEAWTHIAARFGSSLVDWSGYEDIAAYRWQAQLHIYEVPFYYIEYAMAQLGAIGVWRNFESDKNSAIEAYTRALSAGYTRNIPALYELAGVRFDFSASYIRELMQFVQKELSKLA